MDNEPTGFIALSGIGIASDLAIRRRPREGEDVEVEITGNVLGEAGL
jgi:hypothetical protein